jgi:hypothetical protein
VLKDKQSIIIPAAAGLVAILVSMDNAGPGDLTIDTIEVFYRHIIAWEISYSEDDILFTSPIVDSNPPCHGEYIYVVEPDGSFTAYDEWHQNLDDLKGSFLRRRGKITDAPD